MDKKKYEKARKIDDELELIKTMQSQIQENRTLNTEILNLLDDTTRDNILDSVNSILRKRSRELREEFFRI